MQLGLLDPFAIRVDGRPVVANAMAYLGGATLVPRLPWCIGSVQGTEVIGVSHVKGHIDHTPPPVGSPMFFANVGEGLYPTLSTPVPSLLPTSRIAPVRSSTTSSVETPLSS